MSSFTDPLAVVQEGGRWRTLRDIHYWTHCSSDDDSVPLPVRCTTVHVVPAGFLTDFASIPRVLWSLIGHPAGRYAQAAVLHDWLLEQPAVPRAEADRVFLEAMAVLGVPRLQRWLMWAAVRAWGLVRGARAAQEAA
ncbi:MAG: hypothetical protein AMXMBFR78_33920 [Rubrivivax sp.]